jgi:hypothetical protein
VVGRPGKSPMQILHPRTTAAECALDFGGL